jgi:hypothetical protein
MTRNASYEMFCCAVVSVLPSLLISALTLEKSSELRELKQIKREAVLLLAMANGNACTSQRLGKNDSSEIRTEHLPMRR